MPVPGPHFAHIADPRLRLEALLNYGLRGGSAGGDAMAEDALRGGVDLDDHQRDVVARHLIALMEDEVGAPIESWLRSPT